MKRFSTFAAGVAVVALALAGCSGNGSNPNAGNTLSVITPGSLTICSDLPYAPFEYEDATAPSGYAGFDIDLISAIADGLGLKVVVIPSDFNALQSGVALEAGSCDLGASAITITDERRANLDFSDPYYDSLQSLMVRADSGIKTLADLAGKKIGVQTGTTGENYAKTNAPSTAQIVSFPSDGEEWLAMQAGQVDALLQDLPVNQIHTKADSSYAIVEKYDTNEQYGFALAKGKNPALLAAINTGLKTLRDNGTYNTLYAKYFG